MKRISQIVALGLLSSISALFLVACGSGYNSGPKVRGVTVAPTSATINVGGTQQFTALVYYSDGSSQDGTTLVNWTSSSSAVATIAAGGLAAGAGPGTATITASTAGFSATAALTVSGPTMVTVTPASATINAGATQQFTATATFSTSGGGTTTQDVSALATWSSTNTSVATVNGTGLATGVGTGSATISATYAGASGNANLTVGVPVVVGLKITPANPSIAVGTTTSLTAVEFLSNGTTQPTTGAVTWVSSDTTKVTVGNTTGIASGVAAGTSVITASEGGTTFTGTTTVTVKAAVARFAYLADSGATTNSAYTVDTTKSNILTPLTITAGSKQDLQLIVHPSGHFVYAIDGTNFVAVYHVDNSASSATPGALTLDPTLPTYQAGNGGFGKGTIDPTGQFLYVLDNGGIAPQPANAVYAFKIDQNTGALSAAPGSPFTTNVNGPADVLVDHAGQFLFVVNNGNSTVSSYSINPSSGAITALAANATISTGTSSFPQFSTLDPTGTRLYVPNNGNSTITIYSIANGALTQIGSAFAVTGATSVANVAIDPTNSFLYVVNSLTAGSNVYGFKLNADGTIGAATTASPYSLGTSPLGGNPLGIAIDPTGTFLAVDLNFDNSVAVFTIGTGGQLTPANPATQSSGTAPQFITFYTALPGQ